MITTTPARGRRKDRPPAGRDDEQVTAWALAAGRGDEDAMRQFVEATHADVRRFVGYLAAEGGPAAEDLTQETYLRALSSLPRFAGRSCARTWLLSIARRVVVDRYRYDAARPRVSGAADWLDVADRRQPAGLPGFDEGVALLDLLGTLDHHRREAFVLTQLLCLPYAEAARRAGCPIGTVRSRVARAREELSVMLRAADDPLGADRHVDRGDRHVDRRADGHAVRADVALPTTG